MKSPEHIQRFENALASASPGEELPRLAVALRDEGVSQIELYDLFAHFQIATPGDDPKYDAIVDTMELIYGGPWAKGHGLFATELTEDQIHEHRKKA
jgi:hypothetical protein